MEDSEKYELNILARKDNGNTQRVLANGVNGYIISDINKDTLDISVVVSDDAFEAFEIYSGIKR